MTWEDGFHGFVKIKDMKSFLLIGERGIIKGVTDIYFFEVFVEVEQEFKKGATIERLSAVYIRQEHT